MGSVIFLEVRYIESFSISSEFVKWEFSLCGKVRYHMGRLVILEDSLHRKVRYMGRFVI